MQRPWVKIAGAVVGVIVLVLILVPLFVRGEAFRPTVESQLTNAFGRKTTLGHLSFSLFSGSLVARDIAVADDPAFSTSPFLKAKDIKVGVEVMPLIFSRQVHISSLTIDDPAIQLIQNQAGKWNYSSLGKSFSSAGSSQKSQSVPTLTVGALKIDNGSATLSSIPATARPFVYSGINATVKNFSFTSNFPFELSANLPAGGSLNLSGTAGPIAPADTSETPFQASLDITHLDPVKAGLVEPDKGISGIVGIHSNFKSDGRTLTGTGKLNAAKLQLSRTGSPSPQPIDIDFNISSDLRSRTGHVSDIAIHAGSAAAHVTGTYSFTPQALRLDLRLNAPGLSVDQLEKLLPAFGVQIPSGSQLKGGTLTTNLAITGPATATTISGPAEIDNTSLSGFSLAQKIQGLNLLGSQSSNATDIQTLRANLNSTPQITEITGIYGNLPQLGTATGSGTVAPSGAIDFKLTATLSSNNAVGKLANQAVGQAVGRATGLLGGLLHGGSQQPSTASKAASIPLIITGTASSPSIRASVSGLLRQFQ